MTPAIDLRTCGPSEDEWAGVCARLGAFVWPACRRVVVVSPHPDDETYGAGGLIGVAVGMGLSVTIIAVTDGEAAYPHPDLARVRRVELSNAVDCLDPTAAIETVWLGFADSRVTGSLPALTAEITRLLDSDDLVVCPMPDDGHPDHAAVSVAATQAAAAIGAAVRWFPVWAWHCHDPGRTTIADGQRLTLSPDVRARKERAASCYSSQTEGETPVVPARMLARLLRSFEVFVVPR